MLTVNSMSVLSNYAAFNELVTSSHLCYNFSKCKLIIMKVISQCSIDSLLACNVI